jgi:hypothetical protein
MVCGYDVAMQQARFIVASLPVNPGPTFRHTPGRG